MMPSGGARMRSGPAPDPNSLRQDRKSAEAWVTLPAEGFQGEVPAWPLTPGQDLAAVEADLWALLWRKPQAVMWDKLGLQLQVAAYVRAFVESTQPRAVNGLKTAVLRMEAELGLSLPGMHTWHWKFAEDEVAQRREPSVPVGKSARDRLKVIDGG